MLSLSLPVNTFTFPCLILSLFEFFWIVGIEVVIETMETILNLFVPNAPFLYPPENVTKPEGFLTFSGGRERVHWTQMGRNQKFYSLFVFIFTHIKLIFEENKVLPWTFFHVNKYIEHGHFSYCSLNTFIEISPRKQKTKSLKSICREV